MSVYWFCILQLCKIHWFSSVQLFSRVQLFVTPWNVALQASLSLTISQSLLKLMSIESLMPSNHVILYHPLLLLPSVFPSIRVFSNESALCIRWAKYWSFSFNISPSKNIQDWFPLGWTGWISLQSKGLSRIFSIILLVGYLDYHFSSNLGYLGASPQVLFLPFISSVSYWYPRRPYAGLRAGPSSPRLPSFVFSLCGMRLHTLHWCSQLCEPCQREPTAETARRNSEIGRASCRERV